MYDIVKCNFHRYKCFINPAYRLSYGLMTKAEVIGCEIQTADNRTAYGEVVPLTGYHDTSANEVWEQIQQWKHLKGTSKEILDFLGSQTNSLTSSCVAMAIDYLDAEFCFPDLSSCIVNLPFEITPCNQVIRSKVGLDIDQDIQRCRQYLENFPTSDFRFDANRGFSLKDAEKFIAFLKPFEQRVCLEQPVNTWSEMDTCCQLFSKIIVDELIQNSEDIDHASQIGSYAIKLKYCKMKEGKRELINMSNKAYQKGLNVILGNGFATILTNSIEYGIYQEWGKYLPGFEGIGFQRMKK